MDLKYLKNLLRIFEESNATEITLEEEGSKIKLSKKISHQQFTPVYQQTLPATTNNIQAINVPQNTASPAVNTATVETASDFHEINSPIVGTFYRSPSPESPVFVNVGDRIEQGKTLCIVEAMKLMNEIESDVTGIVEKILVENGKPVEYGQVLFLIRPE